VSTSFEEVLWQMPAGVVIAEAPSGKIIFVNRPAQQWTEQRLGWSMPTKLEDAGHFEIVHPNGRPYEMEEWPLMRSIRDGEEVRDEEFVYPLADGTEILVRCDSSPIYDKEGHIVAGIGVFYDITEQKRAENELHESSSRIENILESITDAFVAWDREWRYTYVNERALHWLRGVTREGLTRRDLLGKNVWEVLPEHVGTELYHRLQEAMREQTTTEFETKSPVANRWLEVHAYPSEAGLSVYFRDVTERKRTEQDLAYRAYLQENVHDAVIATDEQLLVTAWNKGAEQMYGWRADEVLGRPLLEVVPSELGEEERAEALRELSERGRFHTEAITYGKDGTPIYAEGFTIALREEEEGEITGYVTIRRDITERKRAEQRLREAEARYRTLVQRIPAITYIQEIRHTSTSIYVSPQIKEILGYEPEECTSDPEHWYRTLHPDDRERVLGEDRRTNETGEPFSMEYRQIAKDGRVVWLRDEAAVVRNEENEPEYWIGVQLDITGRKQAEKEVERRTHQQAVVAQLGLWALANEDLQSLMDDTAGLVAQTLDVEYCKIVELLPSGEEMLLRSGVGWREGLVGSITEPAGVGSQAGYTLISEEPVVMEDLSAEMRFTPPTLLREHGVVSGMTVVIAGRERPFGVLGAHTQSLRIFSADDVNFLQAVANVLAMAIERKETEKSLAEVREAERSRIARDLHDEALQDLAHAMAQVQLAPLSSRESEISQEEFTERLGRLSRALRRVEGQVRAAIYDLSLEAEQQRPFSELLETLVELQRSMAPDQEISLQLGDGIPDEPLKERGTQLLRILGEAITNARRHSGAHNIRIAVWTTKDRKVCAEVEDDGRGFELAQERLVTPTGGMGIRGMHERARSLGADLNIESAPGEGTKVRLELAMKKDREQSEEEVRILLVEDHATVREAVATSFQQEEGFEVVGQVGSLAEARRMLGTRPVDVALIDLGLPDGYGADLIKDLRDAHPQAQALILSVSIDRAEIARAVERGAAGVLNKSAHLDEVVDSVRRLRAGETLLSLEEVVGLLRYAALRREEEYEARRAIEKLTSREIEVLQALAEGLGSEGIADKLQIALRTERNHMTNILAKLGVHSQLQALVFALRYGVVEIV
jgi:PAS domain S-box-containing protein